MQTQQAISWKLLFEEDALLLTISFSDHGSNKVVVGKWRMTIFWKNQWIKASFEKFYFYFFFNFIPQPMSFMFQNWNKANKNKWKGKPGFRTGEEACGPNTNCVNLEWGYDCECADGYEADPQGTVPIFFCSDQYFCSEHFWYLWKATGDQIECIDIDECSPDLNFCPDQPTGVTCTNSPGTFDCSCDNGYIARFNGTFIDVCEDIDECDVSPEVWFYRESASYKL